jgi:uncharacterized protein
MKVRFAEILDDGMRLEIRDGSWFPDRELERSGGVQAVIVLKRKGMERVMLTGEIKTTVVFACDRCLENYTLDLNDRFTLDLEYSTAERLEPAEHEISPSEMDMIYLREPVIDIFEILKQQIFLMMPEKHLCQETCRGLCPKCGTNLNTGTCDCRQELKSSPFAILKKA